MKKPLSRRILERMETNKKKKAILENMTYSKALDIFNLKSVPDDKELKSLYRKLAMKNHPDHGGSVEKMAEINAAYEYLLNNEPDSSSNKNWDDFFNDIFNDGMFSNSKSAKKKKKTFEEAKRVAEFLKSRIDTVANKIAIFFSEFYEELTGKAISFKIDTLENKIDKVLSGEEEGKSYIDFGYYIRFLNKENNVELYVGINEDIIGVSFSADIIRKTKVNLEGYVNGKKVNTYFGVTNDRDITVDSEKFYSDPASVMRGNKYLSRLFSNN